MYDYVKRALIQSNQELLCAFQPRVVQALLEHCGWNLVVNVVVLLSYLYHDDFELYYGPFKLSWKSHNQVGLRNSKNLKSHSKLHLR